MRRRVLERDRSRCRFCGRRWCLELHHIDYRSQGVDHAEHNLVTLCSAHHGLVHEDKGRWQPLLRAYIWLLYVRGEQHFLVDLDRRSAAGTLS